MKIIKKLIIFVLTFTISTVGILFGVNKTKAANGDIKVSVSSSNTYDSTNNMYIPSGGKVNASVNLSRSVDAGKKVIVEYQTQDYTAVSAWGDYTYKSGTIEFSGTTTSQSVAVYVNNAPNMVDSLRNAFKFVVKKAYYSDGEAVAIDTSKSEILCGVGYNYSYTTRVENGYRFLSDYGITHDLAEISFSSGGGMGRNYCDPFDRSRNFSGSTDLDNRYVKRGFGYQYISGSYNVDASHAWQWFYDDDVWVTLKKDGYKVFEQHQEKKFDDDTYYFSSSVSSSARAGADFVFTLEYADTNSMKFSLNSKVSYWDNTMPTITKISTRNDLIRKDDKIYISVRYSEPVQVSNGDKPILWCHPNSGTQEIQFKYFGGSGTDTLVFMCNASDIASNTSINMNVTKLVPYKLTSSNGGYANIFDFGHDNYGGPTNQTYNYTNGLDPNLKSPLAIQMDLRNPKLSVSTYPSNQVAKSNSAILRVDDATADAKIYYVWSTSDQAPKNLSDYKYCVENSSAKDTGVGTVEINGSGMSGIYYLHVRVVSTFGKEQYLLVKTKNNQAIVFDNINPSITVTPSDKPDESSYINKVLYIDTSESLTVDQAHYQSGIAKVEMYYSTNLMSISEYKANGTVNDNLHVRTIYDPIKANNELKVESTTSSSTKFKLTLTTELDYIKDLLIYDDPASGKGYNTFYIGFVITDNATNAISFNEFCFEKYELDSRDIFETKLSAASVSKATHSNVPERVFAYKTDNAVEIEIQNVDDLTSPSDLMIDKIKKSGETVLINQIGAITSTSNGSIKIKINKNVIGYYELSIKYDSKVSLKYNLYFSPTTTESTVNKTILDNGGEIINYVYEVYDPIFYYKNSGEGVVKDTFYGGIKQPPTFSSEQKAYDYIKFYEEQDFMIYYVATDADAQQLNTGANANRLLAIGEPKTAKQGDYYIRYKKADWALGNTESSSWVYYFYSNSNSKIDIADALNNSNLSKALDQVTKTIISNGGYTFLTDDRLDKDGAPFLYDEQIHPKTITASTSKSGSKFSPDIFFMGDVNIYQSYVDGNKRLASNYEFIFTSPNENGVEVTNYSKIYYKHESETTYHEVLPYANKLKSLALVGGGTGLYTIVELDYNGISIYDLYVDCTAPVIKAYSEDKYTSEMISNTIDSNNDGEVFTAKSFSFFNITDVDDLAYIAVYKRTAISVFLDKVFSGNDVSNLNAVLTDGYYTIRVYDRSGNTFQFEVKTNETDLEVSIRENPNTSIVVSCNREESDIQLYNIYLDDELIQTTYQKTNTFRDDGTYRIHIIDWYGNEFDQTYIFKRELPGVRWRYEKDGVVYIYDGSPEQVGMRILTDGEGEYTLYTNGTLSLVYKATEDYEYKFEENTPNVSDPVLSGTGDTYIRINSTEDYTIVIYYRGHDDVSVTFHVRYDITAPTISASVDEYEYVLHEYEEINEYIQKVLNGEITEEEMPPEQTPFVPKDLKYHRESDEPTRHVLSNGAKVASEIVKVNLQDLSLVTHCQVYLNGELLDEYFNDFGVKEFNLSKNGTYKIIAWDSLNNMSELNFVNSYEDKAKITVDGVLAKIGLKDEDINYGSKGIEISTNEIGDLAIVVEVDDGSGVKKRYAYSFSITEVEGYGRVVNRNRVYYTRKKTEMEIPDSDPILVYQGIEIIYDELIYTGSGQYIYTFGGEEGLNFQAICNEESFKIIFNADKTKDFDIEAKFNCEAGIPIYSHVIISNKASEVGVKTKDNVIHKVSGVDDELYINQEFSIEKPIDDSDITRIYVQTTEQYVMGEEDDYTLIYDKDTDYYNDGDTNKFTENDVYFLSVVNKYGVTSRIVIMKSDTFNISKKVIYKDGESYTYSNDYNKDLYSNGTIEIRIMSLEANVSGFKDNKSYIYKVYKPYDDAQYFMVTLAEIGSYSFDIVDQYGNLVHINATISDSSFELPNDLITGFNQKALLKDSGYTNGLLSVNKQVFDNKKIGSVAYEYNGEKYYVIDIINENSIIPDSYENLICKDGSGLYTIIVRDIYGNEVKKNVHYQKEATLIVSRTTRSNGNSVAFDIEDILKDGFYSNNTIKFETGAVNYVFKVDDIKYELDYTLQFAQGVEKGTITYKIYYLDEYGFEYEFEAYLYRAEVELEATNLDQFIEVDALLTTSKSFTVEFTKDAVCTYLLKDKTYTYNPGDVIRYDGIYRFTAIDKAGNIASVTYKKDSICEYVLRDTFGSKDLINGDVSNSDKVAFYPSNGDSTKIELVYHNGKKVEDFKDDRFSESGHWEILVTDAVGNKSFFEFYIITFAMRGFDYTTPYTYVVTDLYFTPKLVIGEGARISNLGFVNQLDNASQFRFGSFGDEIHQLDDGFYEVTMYSKIYGRRSTFTFTIDNERPLVELVGCLEGEETVKNVTIKGYSVGDTIEVYKNGKLIKTVKVLTNSTDVPVISEGGNYEIVVTNAAGISQSLKFVRKHISNGAGSTLIIIGALALVTVLYIGLVYRTKSKVDK